MSIDKSKGFNVNVFFNDIDRKYSVIETNFMKEPNTFFGSIDSFVDANDLTVFEIPLTVKELLEAKNETV
jgi:hypothetical protein